MSPVPGDFRVALVQPALPDGNYLPSLGLLTMAAVMRKQGFAVRIFDENLAPGYLDALAAWQPGLAGFSVVTAALPRVGRAVAELKLFSPVP